MAKIIEVKKLNLRTRFQIVRVELDCVDLNSDVDYCYVETMVDSHSVYSGFRFIAGSLSSSGTYFTYWLCSLEPRYGISDKDIQMYKDIINFIQY